MLKKRIIPCLDVKNGRTVKGVNFVNIIDAGDPVELAGMYAEQGADELVFLDITATIEGRQTFLELIHRVAQALDIPFTVGGGISELDHAARLIQSGADKVSINSSAVRNPSLIEDIAGAFGSQCLVVAIDSKQIAEDHIVFTKGGRHNTGIKTFEWAREAVDRGAGEILLTSMDKDGTRSGFDLPLLSSLSTIINVPVIASGGAGTMAHFKDVFEKTNVDAALAASLFHYREMTVRQLKDYLSQNEIAVRCI